MNVSNEQALKYYKHELEAKVNKLKKEISDLKILVKLMKGKKLGFDRETNKLVDNILLLDDKKKELSKILNIIGE